MSLIAAISISCTPVEEKTPAQELLTRIETGISNNVIMLGHQDDPIYGHSWKYEANSSDVLEVVGDYPAIMGWELGGIELGDSASLDGVPFDVIREEIAAQDARGGINTISWHVYNPNGGNSWDEEAGVVTSILEGGKHYDMFQKQLTIVSDFLGSLKDAEGNLIPIIFRPWHEHDGNWFWWGDKWCTHAEYIALWEMTHGFMTNKGLDNLVWCYMPIFNGEDKVPAVETFDMLGIDEYQQGMKSENYISGLKKKIGLLNEYREKYNKPITISETGSESLPVENWFSDIVLPAIENEPISYVLFWRNAWDKENHFYVPYKGHQSEDDFRKFVETPKIITAKEMTEHLGE